MDPTFLHGDNDDSDQTEPSPRLTPGCVCVCVGGGGGGTLIFSNIRRLGPFLGVQNFEFQYFWGFSEKMYIFWGMKILWIFFGVIPKLD